MPWIGDDLFAFLPSCLVVPQFLTRTSLSSLQIFGLLRVRSLGDEEQQVASSRVVPILGNCDWALQHRQMLDKFNKEHRKHLAAIKLRSWQWS